MLTLLNLLTLSTLLKLFIFVLALLTLLTQFVHVCLLASVASARRWSGHLQAIVYRIPESIDFAHPSQFAHIWLTLLTLLSHLAHLLALLLAPVVASTADPVLFRRLTAFRSRSKRCRSGTT